MCSFGNGEKSGKLYSGTKAIDKDAPVSPLKFKTERGVLGDYPFNRNDSSAKQLLALFKYRNSLLNLIDLWQAVLQETRHRPLRDTIKTRIKSFCR